MGVCPPPRGILKCWACACDLPLLFLSQQPSLSLFVFDVGVMSLR